MIRRTVTWTAAVALIAALAVGALAVSRQWEVHDLNRPLPPVVTPGKHYGDPPSDAVVLFDGSNLDAWQHVEGGPARWEVKDGHVEINKTGSIRTKESFGDIQLHLEWRSPYPPAESGQKRGNSGVFLMGRYEVQILDSYDNATYADGLAASLYGQQPPMVNASRKPGEWQTMDIIFRAPHFEGNKVVRPARVTVLHNGLIVQDATEFTGSTTHGREAVYTPHPPKGPIMLQDHNDDQPLRFRNIWVRPIKDPQ